MNTKSILLENYALRKALERIQKWDIPKHTGVYQNGQEISFSYQYGSNGERDYIRNIAKEALNET